MHRDAPFQWKIDNQLSRRNLTPEQRAYYIGRKYLAKKKEPAHSPVGHFEPSGRTVEKTAAETGESVATIKPHAAFAQGVDALEQVARSNVLSGKSGQTKAEISTTSFCRDCRITGPKKGCKRCTELRREEGLLERPAAPTSQ
jgi:hypothetical protein